MSDVVLIPGLKVDIDGTSDTQGRVVAEVITVDGDDLETAEMIQAGLHPTAEQVEANTQKLGVHGEAIAANQEQTAANEKQIAANMKDIEENTDRFTSLSEYDVKGEATLKFNVGSATISASDQKELKKLAQTVTGQSGYLIEVTGFADSSGGAAMNTKLRENRAKAAINYLTQQGNVPVRHIVAPGAMGEYGSAASNETKSGQAENRRVTVKILVNKGIAGS